jgi:hypothetical protein
MDLFYHKSKKLGIPNDGKFLEGSWFYFVESRILDTSPLVRYDSEVFSLSELRNKEFVLVERQVIGDYNI